MQVFKPIRKMPIWLSMSLLGFLVLPILGQDTAAEPAEKTVGPFSGAVVDAAEKPVAGAKVWLLGGSLPNSIRALAQTVSGENGRFQFEKVKYEIPSERGEPVLFLARDAGGRIGGADRFQQGPNNAQPKELQLKLQEVKDCRGRLTDASGQPITKAKIRPMFWSYEHREERFFGQELFFIHADLGNELAAETDAGGDFTLRNVPAMGRS